MKVVFKARVAGMISACVLGFVVRAMAQGAPDDPIAYWSFNDARSIFSNRVVSSSYHDAVVLKGLPTVGVLEEASGIVGSAMVLDGASGIRLPYHQDNLGTSFTLALWYWQKTNDTRQCVFQSRGNWTISYETIFGSPSFANHIGQEIAGYSTTALKAWVHVVHTVTTVNNTTTLAVYTNGVLQLTKSVAADAMFGTNQVRGLHVGVCRDVALDGGRCFKGMIDELALWGRALSATEVFAVYQRGLNGQELEFTAQAVPAISWADRSLTYALQTDDTLPGGLFQNGWLRSRGAKQPGSLTDTAQAEYAANGGIRDTAGSVDGPFDAVAADLKWRIPLTSAMRAISQGDFTAEAWFRTTNNAALHVIMGNFSSGYNGVVNLQLDGVNQVRMYLKNTSGTVDSLWPADTGLIKPRDGQWHHLAGIRSGTMLILYLDGMEVGRMTASGGAYPLGGDNYYLGRDARGSFGQFIGEIGDARLWTRALSSNEVGRLVAFSKPGSATLSKEGLLAEYALYNPVNAMSAYGGGYQVAMTPRIRQIPQTNFTYEVVFRSTDTGRGILLGNYVDNNTATVNNFELYTNNEIRFLQRATNTWVGITRSAASVNTRDGAWHRAAVVRNNGQLTLYLDGQQLGASQSDPLGLYVLSGTYLGLGCDFRPAPAYPLNGDLAQTRIWTRALRADELAGLAASNAVPAENLIVQYAPIASNSLHTAGFTSTHFLRSSTTGTNSAALVFTDLPQHTKISMGLLLAQLDALDPLLDGDHFAIKIDGTEVLRVGLGSNQGSKPQVNTFNLLGSATDVQVLKNTLVLGGQDLFGCGGTDIYNDHVYNLSLLEALQNMPHTNDTLVIEFLGIQNAAGENEGFGIDQIQVTLHPPKGTLIRVL